MLKNHKKVNEQQLTTKESLDIIRQMMDQARFNFSRGSFFFILWGTLLAVCSVLQYTLVRMGYSEGNLAWAVASVLGAVASYWYGKKWGRETEVTTIFDRVYVAIWITYMATLPILATMVLTARIDPGPFIMVLTGLATIISGWVLRFAPLVIGGVLLWAFALIIYFVLPDFGSLIFALGMVTSYIIPGIIMKKTGIRRV